MEKLSLNLFLPLAMFFNLFFSISSTHQPITITAVSQKMGPPRCTPISHAPFEFLDWLTGESRPELAPDADMQGEDHLLRGVGGWVLSGTETFPEPDGILSPSTAGKSA